MFDVTVHSTGVEGPQAEGSHNHGKSQLCMKPFPLLIRSISEFYRKKFSRPFAVRVTVEM